MIAHPAEPGDEAKALRKTIFDTISDSLGKLFYNDRRTDPDLPVGAIEKAVADGVITEQEIVYAIAEQVHRELTPQTDGEV